MTLEGLKNNQALFDACMKEVEEKVRAGQELEQAKIEVFRAHGVQFDEDALKAKLVEKMQLSDDELQNVTGGSHITNWCWIDDACIYALKHHDEDTPGDACSWDYECLMVYECTNSAGKW